VAILEVVAGSTKAPLVINRIVGDAVISYGFDEEILNPQTLVDVLENAYVVYRRALEQMVLNTTCRCNACANLSSLDLKFIVHHGEFSIREMAGNMELIGPDVNLVFRLAKTTIKERLGIGAYIAYSDSATDALGLDGFVSSLQTLIEDVDDFAQITIHVADMHQIWDRRRYESLVSIPDSDVMLSFTRDIHAPVGVVWDHLTDPAKRARLFLSEPGGTTPADGGMMEEGAAYVCAHGKYRVPHRIVDWIPLRQYTFESENPYFLNLWQLRLSDLGDITRLDITVGKSRSSLTKRVLMGLPWKRYTRHTTIKGLDEFTADVEERGTMSVAGHSNMS
jgi:hypothetical protein